MLTSDALNYIEERAKDSTWHKDSFNCKKCPKNGCPAWWDFTWNMYNKELKVHSEKKIQGCGFVLQPIFMADIVVNSYNQMDNANRIGKGVEKIAQGLDAHTSKVKEGLVALMKLIGVKDVQRILVENKELRQKLEEKNINLIEEGES